MTTIKATITGRRLELDVPADWPDGTEVEIHPVQQMDTEADSLSPQEIAHTLAAMDLIEPFEMTAEEETAWEADRRARKEREKAEFAEHAGDLRRVWE
ncbi:MAG: hypothetical protein HYR84_10450 [Planctomycetes bacterium]|nr:hypothetical protein [Planctomycetota bacterium]